MAIVPKTQYRVRIRKYKGEDPIPDPDPVPLIGIENYLNNLPISPPSGVTVDFYKDIPYGSDPLEKLDIMIPRGGRANKPVVFYIHGGGFINFNKEQAYSTISYTSPGWNLPEDVRNMLAADISFVSIDYPKITPQSPSTSKNIIDIYEIMKYAVQFVKYHSEELKIDKNKVSLTGDSAGATFAGWIFVRDEMRNPQSEDPVLRESTFINTIVLRYTPTTLDPLLWEEKVFVSYGFNFMDTYNQLPTAHKNALLAQFGCLFEMVEPTDYLKPEVRQIIDAADFVESINQNTREFWVGNYTSGPPTLNMEFNAHHGEHARYIHDRALSQGVPHVAYYMSQNYGNETISDFLIRKSNT